MMISTTFNPVNDSILIIIFIAGVIASARTRIPRQTVKDLQELVNAQTKSIAELKQGRLEDARIIGELQGQITSYKELPLQQLAKDMKTIADSNNEILEVLRKTSIINAEDRAVLTGERQLET